MSTRDHDQLVSIIRGVHETLRKNYQKKYGNYCAVWSEHLQDVNRRHQYSQAMLELATVSWQEKNTRITWCHETAMEYFYGGKLEKLLQRSSSKEKGRNNAGCCENINNCVVLPIQDKIKLLDVGSCYNPFSIYSEYHCVPIDLTPAVENVFQCDFLQLEVVPSTNDISLYLDSKQITELPSCSFEVVVFSLVLEYLPAPEQRWLFCCKAWKLLKYNGLLLIITPDSKKQHHNAPMMRRWRLALQTIGFQRIAYEKQTHIHCMAFKKIDSHCDVQLSDESTKSLCIPQDFHTYTNETPTEHVERTEEEDMYVQSCFMELPYL